MVCLMHIYICISIHFIRTMLHIYIYRNIMRPQNSLIHCGLFVRDLTQIALLAACARQCNPVKTPPHSNFVLTKSDTFNCDSCCTFYHINSAYTSHNL